MDNETLNKEGCEFGRFNRSFIERLEKDFNGIGKKISAIDKKLYWGLILMVLLSSMAGINLLKLVIPNLFAGG